MREPEKPAEPPMTPMIDVIFQLLIFFILTMQFKQEEGKLLSQLPKGIAPDSRPAPPEEREIRIVLCCSDETGEQERHLTHKGAHDADLERQEIGDFETTRHDRAAHPVLNDVCFASVERNPIGSLFKTWVCPSHVESPLSSAKRAAENRGRYREIAAKVKELHSGEAPVILDADRAVPYEHIVGVLNACKEAGLPNLEFAAR